MPRTIIVTYMDLTNAPKNWKRTVGGKIGRMTKDDALAALAAHRAEHTGPGATIFSATIRELTGGYNSQSINGYVLRKLGVKAGLIRNPN